MDKQIIAKVNIKDDYSNIKTFKIYGNYSVIESPINNSLKSIEYLGNYDETANKYIVPININGNTINISLDEPLRKLDDIADYIDLENQIVVRRVKEKVFDGNELILDYENGVYIDLIHNLDVPAISNYYNNNTEEEIHFTSTINSNAIYFRVNENADEFKILLTERYNSNEPLKILYVLNKQEFEHIKVPDFDIKDTNNLTVCTNNDLCSSNIEVEFDK